jgi:hypothetical protein
MLLWLHLQLEIISLDSQQLQMKQLDMYNAPYFLSPSPNQFKLVILS